MLKKLFITVACTILYVSSAHAAGDAAAGKEKSVTCGACHGVEGVSAIALQPHLAGQVTGYIAAQLKAFKSGDRDNAIMAGQAASLSEQDMADLDAYYVSLSAAPGAALTDEQKTAALAGEAIYRGGLAKQEVAACMSCHGPSGNGIPKHYPRVSAQRFDYLEQQLLAYKKGDRVGHKGIMHEIAFSLSEDQITQLAAYMAGLK